MDWWKLSEGSGIRARIFADKRITFHPKVLIVTTRSLRFAVIGSGNLSAGGLVDNIECGLYSDFGTREK